MFPCKVEMLEECDFQWGKRIGDSRYYESFTYDGIDYTLYDCVYMFKLEEPVPYIGKLIGIWENADKSKQIDVQWFFRPEEISYYLRDTEVEENELFLASGAGDGLSNINDLEAIAGKCNVVCISTDSRNPQSSDCERLMADYVFSRTFDVGNCTISDQFGDMVGELRAEFVFNRKESGEISGSPKFDSNNQYDEKVGMACEETLKITGKETHEKFITLKPEENCNHMMEYQGTNTTQAQEVKKLGEANEVPFSKKLAPAGECSADVDMKAGKNEVMNAKDNQSIIRAGTGGRNVNGEKDEPNGMKSAARDVQGEETAQSAWISNEAHKYGPKEFNRSGQAAKLANDSSAVGRRGLKRNEPYSKENPNLLHYHVHEKDDATLARDSYLVEKRALKKFKVIDSMISIDKNNANVESLKKISASHTKNSLGRNVGKGKLRNFRNSDGLYKVISEEDYDKRGKLSHDILSKLPTSNKDENRKFQGRVLEVTRRPIVEKPTWFKELPWKEEMKSAYDERRLVLLQNLDPLYTAGEIEDIIWCAFRENVTARMDQHTAVSNPHSGQAFAMFKTREAVQRVVMELGSGCLMLPNQRPLVICTDFPLEMPGRQTKFAGHLTINKVRRRELMEMKEAVSTAHYAQNNTIEFDMAMEWRLLQAKSDSWWKALYEEHEEHLQKLMAVLQSK